MLWNCITEIQSPFQNSKISIIEVFCSMMFSFSHWSPDLNINQVWGEGLPWWLSNKEEEMRCRSCDFNLWVRKIPWRRAWQPTPLSFLKNPMDRGAWRAIVHGASESDAAEWLSAYNTSVRSPFQNFTTNFFQLQF